MKNTEHPDWITTLETGKDWSEILTIIRSTAVVLKLRLQEKASHDPVDGRRANTIKAPVCGH